MQPCFDTCVNCSSSLIVKDVKAAKNYQIHMSIPDGGLVCEGCANKYDVQDFAHLFTMSFHSLMVAKEMLGSTLDHVAEMNVPIHVRKELLIFCKRWTSEHLHCTIKSLNMMCD